MASRHLPRLNVSVTRNIDMMPFSGSKEQALFYGVDGSQGLCFEPPSPRTTQRGLNKNGLILDISGKATSIYM